MVGGPVSFLRFIGTVVSDGPLIPNPKDIAIVCPTVIVILRHGPSRTTVPTKVLVFRCAVRGVPTGAEENHCDAEKSETYDDCRRNDTELLLNDKINCWCELKIRQVSSSVETNMVYNTSIHL